MDIWAYYPVIDRFLNKSRLPNGTHSDEDQVISLYVSIVPPDKDMKFTRQFRDFLSAECEHHFEEYH